MPVENHILARLSGTEVLTAEDRADWFRSCLMHIATHEKAKEFAQDDQLSAGMNNDDGFWPPDGDWKCVYRPYIVKDGVLQIPVFGVLLNRFSYQVGRYATGYTYILRCLQRGLADGNVRGIAWIHDSPGGEVAGCFELGDKIYEARGQKPMRAFSAEAMYSASYCLGSAADSISVTRTSGVGSIGVVTAHVDYSKMLEKEGIKVTFIYAGKHKVDGNPYQALPDDVKDRIQARIDRLYGIFCGTVARNRAMDEDDVRGTEAATFTAEEAIDVELADRVGIFEEEIEAFRLELDGSGEQAQLNEGEDSMSKFTQEQMDAAVASARQEEQAKHTTALSTATTEAAAAAKTRITAIIGCEEAAKRPKAAHSAAMNTDMSLEQAKAFLATLPEEKVEAAAPEGEKKGDKTGENANAFAAAMGKGNPEVGAGDGKTGSGGEDEAKGGNPLTAALTAAGGMKPKAKAA